MGECLLARWVDWLRQDEGALADFRDYLDRMRAVIQREQDEVTDFQQFLEVRGRKKTLDEIETFVTLYQQEDVAYAKYRQHRR